MKPVPQPPPLEVLERSWTAVVESPARKKAGEREWGTFLGRKEADMRVSRGKRKGMESFISMKLWELVSFQNYFMGL
jgi:hypothetical protein